jgi:hypothetical protein
MPALAQRDMGTVLGTVTDATGSVVPNARVTIIEEATGIVNNVETDGAGNYLRPLLKPGNYRVEVQATGFKKAVQTGIVLSSQGRVQANFILELGEVTETIEVTAQPPALQTESAQMGGRVISPAELPLGGQRKFAYLARNVPAVYPAEAGARDATGGGFSANGVRSNGQNNFLLNGVDNNVNVIDFINQTAYVIGPSVEAIGEMQVLTNGYNAEYGRGAGGVVNVTIKSGTNEIHGAVFEFLQNDNVNANTWEANKNAKPKGAFIQNQFGAAVGGPIIRDRTFWFADYQGTRISDGSLSSTVTIPTAAMRGGDFSGLLTGATIGTDAEGRSIQGGQIFNPFTQREVGGVVVRDPFTNNQIPTALFDPAAKKLFDQFPNPNQNVRAGRPGSNYFTQRASTREVDQWDVRVDHRLSDNDSIFGSISWIDEAKYQSPTLPGDLDTAGFLGETEDNLSRNAMLSYSKIWSPTLITESRVAYSRLITTRTQANAQKNTFKDLGIGGFDPFTVNNGGLMRISPESYSDFGGAEWLPTQEYNNVWDFIQNVSWNKGSHAFKFGAEYRPVGFPFFQVPSPRGLMNFRRDRTNQIGFGDTGDGAAAWLIGQPGNSRITTQNFISSYRDSYSFYGQDDWKVSSRLTINLGLRYEITSPIGEKFGRQAHLDVFGIEHSQPTLVIPKGKDQDTPLSSTFAATYPGIAVERGVASTYLIGWDKTNLAPRIGIAYELTDRTVIRTGYGIFYGAEENEGGNPNRGEQPPFNYEVQFNPAKVSDPNPAIGTFSDGFPVDSFSRPALINFRSVYTNRRWPLVHKWNFALQRDIGWDSVFELAYIGSKGQRLTINYNGNRPIHDPRPNIDGLARRPVKEVGNVDIQATNSFGRSNYHALAAKLEKRFSHGTQFQAAYTWGHALTDVGSPLSEGPGYRTVDIASEYSTASFDVRHRFVLSGLWELPVGNKLTGVAHTLAGGWQLNGILSLQTGNYMSIGSTGAVCSCSGDIRPDVVPGKDPNAAPSAGRTPEQWMDISAFQAPAAGTYGNLGNFSNIGPGTHTLDLSLFKDFRINERFRVQFRAESFNLTNTPQFDRPARTRGNNDFGVISATRLLTNRQWQFALRLMF